MRKLSFITGFFIVLVMAACSKKETQDPANNNNNNNNNSTLKPALLKVTVQEMVNGRPGTSPNAYVQLFKTDADRQANKNAVTDVEMTDATGAITFDSLEPITYHFNVYSNDYTKSNATGGTNTGMNLERGTTKSVNVLIK